jgi:hypothetical protein
MLGVFILIVIPTESDPERSRRGRRAEEPAVVSVADALAAFTAKARPAP